MSNHPITMSYRRLIEVDEDSPLTEDHDGSNENIKEFESHVSFILFNMLIHIKAS